MTLEEFNSKYKYQSDKEKFRFIEVWEIPKLQEDGFYYGDCESYCRFLKANIPEFKDWEYYYCKLNGVGHCILYKNGDIIDCNIRAVISCESFYKTYIISDMKKYNKVLIWNKIIFSKGYLLWRKLKGL